MSPDYQNIIRTRINQYTAIGIGNSFILDKLSSSAVNCLNEITQLINEIETLMSSSFSIAGLYNIVHDDLTKKKDTELESLDEEIEKLTLGKKKLSSDKVKKINGRKILILEEYIKTIKNSKRNFILNLTNLKEINNKLLGEELQIILKEEFSSYKLQATKNSILEVLSLLHPILDITIKFANLVNSWDKQYQERLIKDEAQNYLFNIEQNILGMKAWIISVTLLRNEINNNLISLYQFITDYGVDLNLATKPLLNIRDGFNS